MYISNGALQNLAAETAAYLTTKHPDYAVLAARIAISNLHKETKKNFSAVIKDLYEYSMPVPCLVDCIADVFQSTQRMVSPQV